MIEIIGLKEVQMKLEGLSRSVAAEVGPALYQEALIEQRESMRRTPVDTGAIRSSHETSRPQWSGREVSVKISVGGPAAPYALVVHEDLEKDHKTGQAKFLESTLNESRPYLAARIAKRIELNRLVK